MKRQWNVAIVGSAAVISLLLLLGGCRRKQPTPVAVTPAKQEVTSAPAVESEPAQASETEPSHDTPAAESEPTPALPAVPTFGSERILLFTPGNPLIVDLQLSIDGHPHTEALERLVDEVLKLADADGDERTTWKEIFASRRVKYGQYGNLPIDNESGEKQIIERYDIARDGMADRTELPRFLTRNAGGAKSFSIRGTLDRRDLNRRGSATWRVVDADEDGAITVEEMNAATARLSARDNDDDEIVLPGDLDPQAQAPDPDMMRDRRRRGPDAARLLGPHADWSSVQIAMEQYYSGGRTLRLENGVLSAELFAQLDKNKDGRLQKGEIASLNELPADVVLAVEFGSGHGTGDGEQGTGGESAVGDRESEREAGDAPESKSKRQAPRLKLLQIAPRLVEDGRHVMEQPGRITLAVSGVLLTFYTNDTVASEDFATRAKQALEMFDQNKDGYLEKSEVPETLQGQLGRFEALDADDDGKAYPKEIEAFLAQQQAGLRSQIHARATDGEDLLFAALDADHDNRLDGRELTSAPQRLASLDKNADAKITPDELPEMLLLALARGSLENADATFAAPPLIERPSEDKSPRWFTAMDANRDGVISRREFIGPAEKFAELDRDGNGLLELAEVGKLMASSR